MGKIYLLVTHLYTKEGKHVYKLGRSDQTGLTRLKDYHTECEILIVIACENSKQIERDLIQLFKQKYTLFTHNEYFVGDKHQMIDDIIELVRKERKQINEKIDLEKEILEYLEKRKIELKKKEKLELEKAELEFLNRDKENLIKKITQKRLEKLEISEQDKEKIIKEIVEKERTKDREKIDSSLLSQLDKERESPVMIDRSHIQIPLMDKDKKD